MGEKNKSSIWDRVTLLTRLKNIKHIEIYVIIIFVAVLAVVYISSNNNNSKTSSSEFNVETYATNLEVKLKNVLSEISGAGKVSVMVMLDGGMKYEYATKSEEVTTSSSLTNGTNSKTTTNENIVMITQNGKQSPLVIREYFPDVIGVVVVCAGANNVAVKLNIISAVSTLLGVDSNKIEVIVGERWCTNFFNYRQIICNKYYKN